MMPKGVEHSISQRTVTTIGQVRIPMMPKGVEHVIASDGSDWEAEGENSDDAERR